VSDPAEFSVPLGQHQLFVDDVGIEQLSNLKRTLHQPDKKGAVIRSPDPDSSIQTRNAPLWDPDEQVYRVRVLGVGQDSWQSPDGLHWTPDTRSSSDSSLAGVSMVVRDGRDKDAGRRYKAVLLDRGFAVSPDGIEWTELDLPKIQSSDEGNFSYNEEEGLFIHTVKRGTDFGRSVAVATSTDFEHWDDLGVVFSTDAKDQEIGREVIEARRSNPLLQQTEFCSPEHYSIEIYNMGVFRYEGLFIGLPSVYHHTGKVPPEWEGFATMNLSPYIRECVEKYGDYTGFYHIQIASSRNLVDWNRVAERRPFIETSPLDSGAYDLQTMIGPSDVILRGDELWFYYTGIKNYAFITSGGKKGYDDYRADCGAICLAVLRRDGFVSLDSNGAEGSVRTSPFKLEGTSLSVNAAASKGELHIRVLDGEGGTLAQSDVFCADEVAGTMTWRSGDIAQHKEETVRLEFSLRDAQLFSYWLD
jgi:hypothetical protein